jgi:uncharacterized membrane protein YhiD involved in acid resistance
MDFNKFTDLNSHALGLYNLGGEEIFFRLFFSLLLGSTISYVFVKTDRLMENGPNTYMAIIFCPAIISTALMALGNSIATAFGLFAALSIIRFRTPVKSIKEMLYIFFSISVGICMGVGSTKVAFISVATIVFALIIDHLLIKTKKLTGLYTLRIFVAAESFDDLAPELSQLFDKEFKNHNLVEVRSTTSDSVEVIYSIKPKDIKRIPSVIGELNKNDEIQDLIFQTPILG